MSDILSVSTRPTTLSGLYGQSKLAAAIRNHMVKRPPRTWLFSGEAGSGKTTLARILAVSYNCIHMKLWGDPCTECAGKTAWGAPWGDGSSGATWAIHDINAAE